MLSVEIMHTNRQSSHYSRYAVLVAVLSVFCRLNVVRAQETNKPVNLGRLSIARVYASSERKGAHGIQKIFDGRTDTSWISSDRDPWVRVRFTKPVTVQSFAIHADPNTSPSMPPTYYEIHLRHPGEKEFLTYPLVKAQNPTSSYNLPHPVEDVRDVWITFPSAGPIHIDELEILGEPPEGTDTTAMIPTVDLTGQTFVRELKKIEKREIKREEKFLKKL